MYVWLYMCVWLCASIILVSSQVHVTRPRRSKPRQTACILFLGSVFSSTIAQSATRHCCLTIFGLGPSPQQLQDSLIRDSIKLRGLLSIYSYCLQARQWAVVTPEKATRGDKKKCNLRFGLALRTDVCTGFQVTYSIGEERDFFRPVSMESFTSLFTICETLI